MARIFIVGTGPAGSATGRALGRAGHQVTFVDDGGGQFAGLLAEGLDVRRGLDLDGEPEAFVFLCQPDGAGAAGLATWLGQGAAAIGTALASADSRHAVVIRSLVPPGTTEAVIGPELQRRSGRRERTDFGLAVLPRLHLPGLTCPRLWPVPGLLGTRNPLLANALHDLLGSIQAAVRVFEEPRQAELEAIRSQAADRQLPSPRRPAGPNRARRPPPRALPLARIPRQSRP